MGCGLCTNSRAKLLALFGLLYVANSMGLPGISVYGDSLMVIDWVKGRTKLKVLNLEHWCKRINDMVHDFISFSCQHIYREHNQMADRLSKEALILTAGSFIVQEYMEGEMIHEVTKELFSCRY